MSGVHINNIIPNLLVVLKIVIYSFNKSLKKNLTYKQKVAHFTWFFLIISKWNGWFILLNPFKVPGRTYYQKN